ncbi:MAG: IS1 family transposase, partial [Oscillospiraceae bacterium]|nr:IS1 family transposase [Oscillospiraceae bacterium]
MVCKHCGSEKTRKNGVSKGYQRYKCNACGRTFSGTPEKFSAKTKATAVFMSINEVGIRKIALFLGTSHVSVLNWLKKA